MDLPDPCPPALSLPGLFAKFLRFGLLAFGGPVAQIAMLRRSLVDDERWISGERFNRLLAVMQVLPGPEAHELCVHLGMIARGRAGGLLAGLGFMLPGFILMMGCGWAYTSLVGGGFAMPGLFPGVQAVVLAIIVRAVHRIGSHILLDRTLMGMALVAFAGTIAGVPFWALLIAGGAVYALSLRPVAAVGGMVLVAVVAWWLSFGGGPGSVAMVGHKAVTTAALFLAGLKGGLLTFGGAYTAIPYVRSDTVGRGWLPDAAFLDGVALAGLLPAPLVIFATFVGYVAGGWIGAVAITMGMFLPAFAFSLIFYERLDALVANKQLHRLLDGVAAAVVGIIGATFVELGASTIARAPDWLPVVAIFVAAAVALWRFKGAWLSPALIGGGGVAGWLLVA
jgi:chromate transporter